MGGREAGGAGISRAKQQQGLRAAAGGGRPRSPVGRAWRPAVPACPVLGGQTGLGGACPACGDRARLCGGPWGQGSGSQRPRFPGGARSEQAGARVGGRLGGCACPQGLVLQAFRVTRRCEKQSTKALGSPHSKRKAMTTRLEPRNSAPFVFMALLCTQSVLNNGSSGEGEYEGDR